MNDAVGVDNANGVIHRKCTNLVIRYNVVLMLLTKRLGPWVLLYLTVRHGELNDESVSVMFLFVRACTSEKVGTTSTFIPFKKGKKKEKKKKTMATTTAASVVVVGGFFFFFLCHVHALTSKGQNLPV